MTGVQTCALPIFAFAYGGLLNEKSGNLRDVGLQKLVSGYPAHAFVIDRKEARTIFISVEKPQGSMLDISKALYATMDKSVQSPNRHWLRCNALGHEGARSALAIVQS